MDVVLCMQKILVVASRVTWETLMDLQETCLVTVCTIVIIMCSGTLGTEGC